MKRIDLRLKDPVGRYSAEQAAYDKAGGGGRSMLIAWYDQKLDSGGPADVCAGDHLRGVQDYAASHGADLEVAVNDNRLEFYFLTLPPDTMELDRQACLEIHNKLTTDRFDDVQGG